MTFSLSKFFKVDSDPHGFKQELGDLMRGIAGGLIFGAPVLYTMEVWNNALSFSAGMHMLLLLGFLLLNIFFSYFAGLRSHHSSHTLSLAVDDGVTSLGLSLILAWAILYLTGQLDFTHEFESGVRKVLLVGGIMSMGVTFTNFKFNRNTAHLGQSRSLLSEGPKGLTDSQKQSRKDLNDLMAATVGAMVFSFNIAPTEEVTLIASSLSSFNLMVMLVVEIILSFIVLYASGLKTHVTHQQSFFQRPINEVILTVSVALCVSAIMVLVLGYSDARISDPIFIASVIVLGLPATVGAAAGRLVV